MKFGDGAFQANKKLLDRINENALMSNRIASLQSFTAL